MDWINAIVQGILLGGLYALFAAGLSLIFGVMRLVNIAHGDLIVLAAYFGLSTTILLGVHPLVALIVVVPLMALLGYGLQRLILNQTLGDDLLPPLLVSFGLSVIIQNALLEVYSADPQKMNVGVLETASVQVGGLSLGVLPLLTFGMAVVPLMALLGYGLQRLILNQTLGDDLLPPLLVSFGLSVIIQNALLEVYSADPQKMNVGVLETASVQVGGLSLGVLPLLTFGMAVVIIAALHWMFYHTALGRSFRAVSDNQDIAQLMGLNCRHVFGVAMALSLAITAVAGVLLGMRTNFDPSIGGARLIFGFEAVIIGGLGNLWGTLIGGVILGVAQTIGAQINPGWQLLAGHITFLVILAVRPRGLFPRMTG